MSKILNDIEINYIENEARTNQMFQYYGVRAFSSSKLKYFDIVSVSYKGLILIKGNSLTGYLHIWERHLYWSTKSYSKEREFEAQSKFPSKIMPIDFIKIANSIYSTENFIVNNNHADSDKFEKYVGSYAFDGQDEELINLILYKNTKIIHSLYPQNKKHNKYKNRTKYPYRRGEVRVELDFKNRVSEIYIPFLDLNFRQKYGLLIEKSYQKQTEVWKVLSFDDKGKYFTYYDYGIKEIIIFSGDVSARITFQYCDLRFIEDFLIKIDDNNLNDNI